MADSKFYIRYTSEFVKVKSRHLTLSLISPVSGRPLLCSLVQLQHRWCRWVCWWLPSHQAAHRPRVQQINGLCRCNREGDLSSLVIQSIKIKIPLADLPGSMLCHDNMKENEWHLHIFTFLSSFRQKIFQMFRSLTFNIPCLTFQSSAICHKGVLAS